MNKKKSETNKTSYRPVSILSNFSKLYEKLIYKKFYQHFETIWFSSQYRSRKGYSAQDCLLMMAKKIKEAVDNDNEFGTLLTNLSEAFNCLDHSLLLAKCHGYGVSYIST